MAQEDFSLLLSAFPKAATGEPAKTVGGEGSVTDIINAAAEKEGVPSELMQRIAGSESGGNPNARNQTGSSAKGLFQFIDSTWKGMGGKPGEQTDPVKNAELGARYIKQNVESLRNSLGRNPTYGEVYAAHFFGAGVAPMLRDANPTERIEQGLARFESRERVAQILQQNPNLRGKTVGQVLSSLESKMGGGTMGGESTQPSFSNVRPLATDRSTTEAITDNLAGAASGVVQGAKLIADAFGANNAVSGALGDASKAIMGTQSQYRKDQRTERNMAIKGAEASGSTWEEIKANVGGFLEAPVETTLNALGTSAPTLLMSVIPGLGQAQAARLILQGATGATQGAGAAKGSIYEAVRDQLVASGMSKDDAEKAAAGAQAYDGQNGGAIAANAILGSLAGTSGIESAAGRIAGRTAGEQATRGVMGRAGVGIAKETPVEFVQGGGERVTSNVALQNEGFDVPTFQGAAGQAVAEGLASAPGGAVFGALDRSGAQTPPPPPNPLQSVVDQAQKPGSVLSRAVVATGATEQPAVAPVAPTIESAPEAAPAVDFAGQTAGQTLPQAGAPEIGNTTGLTGPGPSNDRYAQQAAKLEEIIRSEDLIRSIRTSGAGLQGVMFDLQTMRDPNAREDIKEQARRRVEEEVTWAQTNYAPKPAMDTVAGTPGFEPIEQGRAPREPKREDVMGLEIVQATLRDPNIGPKIGPTDRQIVLQLTAAAQNPGLPLATRQQAAEQAIEIVGRYRAGSNPDAAPQTPALLEQPAPVAQEVASPAEQQTVAAPTVATNPNAEPSAVPAVTRKRAATLRQLADQGFETVERRGSEFFLKNSKTGQEIQLEGMADAQLARNQIRLAVDEKANTAAASPLNDRAEPTQAQIEAGNYKKSDVIELNGMKIKIENPKGSVRRGTSPDGVQWETNMAHHYGEFQGTEGADGDKLDVFVGPRPDSNKVFVIDQVNEDGSFDEHKVMMGFTSEEAARAGYLANYEAGWTGLGAITEIPAADFKGWAKSRAAKKPLAKLPATAATNPQPKVDQKARWIKAILDNSRLAGDTGIQLDVTPDGKLNFLGDPNSSKQGRSLLATLEEARKAGATNKEIADAIIASKRSKAEIAAPQGQYATLEEAKAYLSQQRRSNGNVSGLPIQMADGSFGIAIKGSREYAEAERQRDEREGANKQDDGKSQGTLFTVKDGGKQRQLKKVSKGALPKKSSRQRPGDPRPISQDEATAIEQMAAILGKKVAFYEVADNGGRLADGFVNPGEPNVIYVATETTVNPVAIFGHEFYHTLRETNPAAWNAIAAVVRKRVKDAKGFREDYYGDKAAEERGDAELDMEQGGELEELISDLGGNLMMDADFWGDVFAQIQKDNGKDAKGIIARLAAAIEQMVARVMAAINQGGYKANDFVDDMDAIRAEFAKALAGHIQKTGVSKSAMDAEIKKSVIRVSAEQKALQEFAEVDAQYRGTDQWMKAPNGQPTQLSERQWIQVRTPSFKAWFGDWEAFAAKQGGVWNDDKGEVSKVVDDNGEPLVVYHGTSKGGFSEFKTPGGTGRGDLGIFTTPNLEMAKTYNKRGSTREIQFADMERDAIEGGDTPGYYASFVNIRDPYETDFEGAIWNGERPEQWIVVNEDGETQYTPTGNQFFDSEEKAQEFADSVGGEVEPAPDHWETTDGAVREARSNKNDGAIIRSVIDDGGGYSSYFNDPSDVFVALDPNQLKSATQNTGEFGKRTDDMRFSRDRAVSDVDPDGYNEFTATPEDVALADAYEAENGIRPYITAGQLQVPVKLPNIRKSVKRAYADKDLAKGRENHPILGVPLNKNGTVTLYFPTTNDDARRVARERTLKSAPGSNRVYLTNESSADKVAALPGNISLLGDDVQANVMIHVDPSLLQVDTEHADGRVDFFIPIAEGDAFKGKMSQVKLFNLFAERSEPITRDKTLKDIERGIEESMKRIEGMPERERKSAVTKAKAVLKQEHNVGTLLTENGKLQKTRAGEYDLKHYEGDSVASLGLGLASAQQITEKLSSCPQHANCESLCLGDTSGQNLLYGGEGPFRAGPRLAQYLKTEAMVMHPEEFALVLHNEIKLLESWARKETGFEVVKDEETGEKTKTPKQVYQPSIRLNVTSDFRPVTWAPVIKAMPGVEFYDYTKLDTKPISKNHHLTYSSDGVAQVVDGVAIGNGNYNWDRMLRQMRNGFNVAMAFSDKNDMPKFLVDGSTGERFQVWNGDNYDARFLDPKPGQEGNLFNKGMIVGLTNKDRTKSGLAIALGKKSPASATKAEWKKLINEIASDERFINDKSVPYVLKWVSNQKGEIKRQDLIEFADSPAVKHNGFFMDYNPKRDGDTVVVADQERTKEAYKAQQPKVFEVARFSRDRNSDTYNQRIAALKDLISCLKK